jgi:hypothetical protein
MDHVALALCVSKAIETASVGTATESNAQQAALATQADWDSISHDDIDPAVAVAYVDAAMAGQLACHQARRAWIDDYDQNPAAALAEHPEAWTPEEGEPEWLDVLISAFINRPTTAQVLGL